MTTEEMFTKFYSVYPKKVAKGAAFKAFKKLDPSEELLQEMIAAIAAQSRYRSEAAKANEFVAPWKHPATWITNECWEDEIKSHADLKEKVRIQGKCACGDYANQKDNGVDICYWCWSKKYANEGGTGLNALRDFCKKHGLTKKTSESAQEYTDRLKQYARTAAQRIGSGAKANMGMDKGTPARTGTND